MSVERAVTLEHVSRELEELRPLARAQRWGIVWKPAMLTLFASMFACDGEPYLLEVRCDDYKELPPLFEFIDPISFELGTRRAYPQGTDSFFHSNLVICAPFNRKAYASYSSAGPHSEWKLDSSWMTSKANNTDWSNFSRLGDMLGAIDTRLRDPRRYKGRMGN